MSSIITKRGDDGWTDCLYGARTAKSGPLIEVIGTLDELTAWMGYAASDDTRGDVKMIAQKCQRSLTSVMGEISAGPGNFTRYKSQFGAIDDIDLKLIESTVHDFEKRGLKYDDWQTPSSKWDVACRVARRAERTIRRYHDDTASIRDEVLIFINRMSDLLWILGRDKK